MSNLITANDVNANFLYETYGKIGDAAGFVYDLTNLFQDEHTGEMHDLYDKQVSFLNLLNPEDKVVVVLKIRQSGYSTAIIARCIFEAYFSLYKEIVILSASAAQSQKVLDRIKKAYMSMPEEFRPQFVRQNLTMLEFQHGTKIYSLSSNPDTARGYTGCVYIDEYGVVPEKDSHELWKALYPTLTTGGRIVAISTPKGKKGKFYDLATKSLKELTGKEVQFESVKYRVSIDDVPHVKYARDHKGLFDGLTPEEIEQEFGLAFLDENEDSFYGEDFVMQYLACKDYIKYKEEEITPPLIRDYCEIFPDDVVEDYEGDEKLEIKDEFRIKNNEKIKYLLNYYDEFSAGWDIAEVNDDSFFGISGRRKDNPDVRDVILLMDMKKYSGSSLTQSDHVIRLCKIFNVTSACGDGTGIGAGAMQNISKDDEIGDCWETVKFSNKQIKVDLHTSLKKNLKDNKLKMRWEENKWYKGIYSQMTNLYLINGILKGKGGKDDFPTFLALLNNSFNEEGMESGLFFV